MLRSLLPRVARTRSRKPASLRYTACHFHASVSSNQSLLERYEHMLSTDVLREDPKQRRVVKRLSRLGELLHGYEPPPLPPLTEDIPVAAMAPDESSRPKVYHPALGETAPQPASSKPAATSPVDSDPASSEQMPNSDVTAPDEQESQKAEPQLEPESEPVKVPRGLYLYGEVGTGKSMAMDLFFDHAQVEVRKINNRFLFGTTV